MMQRPLLAATLLAATALATPPALSQTVTTRDTAAQNSTQNNARASQGELFAPNPPGPTFMVAPASSVVGKRVIGDGGRDAGRITSLIVDTHNGQIDYVLVGGSGGFDINGQVIAVPWSAIDEVDARGPVRLSVTADDLRDAPQFSPSEIYRLASQDWRNRIDGYYSHGFWGYGAPTRYGARDDWRSGRDDDRTAYSSGERGGRAGSMAQRDDNDSSDRSGSAMRDRDRTANMDDDDRGADRASDSNRSTGRMSATDRGSDRTGDNGRASDQSAASRIDREMRANRERQANRDRTDVDRGMDRDGSTDRADKSPDRASDRADRVGPAWTGGDRDWRARADDESGMDQRGATSANASDRNAGDRSADAGTRGQNGGATLSVTRNGVLSVMDRAADVSASALRQADVYTRKGGHLGSIDHVMIDTERGRVAFVLIKNGGFLGLNPTWYAAPVEALLARPYKGGYRLQVDESALNGLPTIPAIDTNLTTQLSRRHLAQLYRQFGVTPYWTAHTGVRSDDASNDRNSGG